MRPLILALALLSAPACTVQVVTTHAGKPAGKVYTREEFKKLVMGKSKQEVKDLLGKPDETVDSGGDEVSWCYRRRTTDPDSGKADDSAWVIFRSGKVLRIAF
jgi:outer membrane protein assembly factor BamE (lipoprotein component of BamABCDE complex)